MRFIFSHSALREGWDNPNVFVICTLKHSDNTISRRQEVGRGLACRQPGRRPHGQPGHRPSHQRADRRGQRKLQGLRRRPAEGHQRVAVGAPRKADEAYLPARCSRQSPATLKSPGDGQANLSLPRQERLHDDADRIAGAYHEAKGRHTRCPAPELQPHAEQIFSLIETVFSDAQFPRSATTASPRPIRSTQNFDKKEFQELWNASTAKLLIGSTSIPPS